MKLYRVRKTTEPVHEHSFSMFVRSVGNHSREWLCRHEECGATEVRCACWYRNPVYNGAGEFLHDICENCGRLSY